MPPGSLRLYSGTGDIGRPRRHMAARPFSRGQIISAAQAGFSLVRLDAPSGIRTCAHGSGRALILTPVTCEDQQKPMVLGCTWGARAFFGRPIRPELPTERPMSRPGSAACL
jgi:hypothetical protein